MKTLEAKRELSTHDRKVRRIVREMEKQGYYVSADVRGRMRPQPVGPSNDIPDIIATQNGQTVIIEVKTHGCWDRDEKQVKDLARYAAQEKNTVFKLIVTKPRKKASLAY